MCITFKRVRHRLPNMTIDNKVIFHYENLTVRLYIEMRTENTQREIPLRDLYLNWICLLKCLFLLTIVFFFRDANTFTECSTSPATLPFMIFLLVCAVTLECLNILRDHIIWYFPLVSLMMILSYSISINDKLWCNTFNRKKTIRRLSHIHMTHSLAMYLHMPAITQII